MDEKKVEGQTQPQVSNAVNPAPSGNTNIVNNPAVQTPQPAVQHVQQPVPAPQSAQPQNHPIANQPVQNVAHPVPQANTNVNQPNPHTYNSATTVSKTAQKIDPFAEQNAKRAEKKAQNKKKAKTGIIIGVIAGILILAVVIWFIMAKVNQPEERPWVDNIPEISNDSDSSISEVQRYLQNIYNDSDISGNSKTSKLQAANQAATTILDHGNNSNYTSQIVLAQIQFYLTNGYYNEIINSVERVNVDNLTLQQKLSFYNCLALAYQSQNNQPKYDEYSNLMLKISIELNGTGEYADE